MPGAPAAPPGNEGGREKGGAGRSGGVFDPPQQELDTALPELSHGLVNGSERWLDKSRELRVVEAGDRDVAGNGVARRAKGHHDGGRHLIVACHDRSRQSLGPVEKLSGDEPTTCLGEVAPKRGGTRDRETSVGQCALEPCEAPCRIRRTPRPPHEHEISIAVVGDQVRRERIRPTLVVGMHEVGTAYAPPTSQEHDRKEPGEGPQLPVGQALGQRYQAVDPACDCPQQLRAVTRVSRRYEHRHAGATRGALGSAKNLVRVEQRLMARLHAWVVKVREHHTDDPGATRR